MKNIKNLALLSILVISTQVTFASIPADNLHGRRKPIDQQAEKEEAHNMNYKRSDKKEMHFQQVSDKDIAQKAAEEEAERNYQAIYENQESHE